jgi:hypothetical protein
VAPGTVVEALTPSLAVVALTAANDFTVGILAGFEVTLAGWTVAITWQVVAPDGCTLTLVP